MENKLIIKYRINQFTAIKDQSITVDILEQKNNHLYIVTELELSKLSDQMIDILNNLKETPVFNLKTIDEIINVYTFNFNEELNVLLTEAELLAKIEKYIFNSIFIIFALCFFTSRLLIL